MSRKASYIKLIEEKLGISQDTAWNIGRMSTDSVIELHSKIEKLIESKPQPQPIDPVEIAEPVPDIEKIADNFRDEQREKEKAAQDQGYYSSDFPPIV